MCHAISVSSATDIDECQDRSLCVNGRCRNTEGSFRCVCSQGYVLSATGDQCEGKLVDLSYWFIFFRKILSISAIGMNSFVIGTEKCCFFSSWYFTVNYLTVLICTATYLWFLRNGLCHLSTHKKPVCVLLDSKARKEQLTLIPKTIQLFQISLLTQRSVLDSVLQKLLPADTVHMGAC